ncbi:kinase-like protein, partial [Fragilariopsis cylindrus CCMP1102]
VANALEYIHSKNVVYRDLKPQNIGFASIEDGQENKSINVKLMDFGLARELPSSVLPYNNNSKNNMLFNMTGTVGTMRYMSPEICLNKPYGLEADIYSWSIVSYGILTQTRPY